MAIATTQYLSPSTGNTEEFAASLLNKLVGNSAIDVLSEGFYLCKFGNFFPLPDLPRCNSGKDFQCLREIYWL
jgi:hypothetical protein